MHLQKDALGDIPGIFKVSNLPFDEAKNSWLIAMKERFKSARRSFLALGHKLFVCVIHCSHDGF